MKKILSVVCFLLKHSWKQKYNNDHELIRECCICRKKQKARTTSHLWGKDNDNYIRCMRCNKDLDEYWYTPGPCVNWEDYVAI